MRLSSFYLLILSILVGGCSEATPNYNPYSTCKKIPKPNWIDDSFVGISRITASGSKTEQKLIAIKRAIAILLTTKGIAQGTSTISVEKELTTKNQNEFYTKNFQQNSNLNIKFKNIAYDIKITDIWKDPCTQELYVKIVENRGEK